VEKMSFITGLIFRWKFFKGIKEESFIILTKLGYQKALEIPTKTGLWQVYKLDRDIATGSRKEKISYFYALYRSSISDKQFSVAGQFENIDDLVNNLKFLSSEIFLERCKFSIANVFSISQADLEKARDYGYVCGLITGFVLMLVDIFFWQIKSPGSTGILYTFIDYTRLVYYGTPGFAIVVGMGAIGIYFTVLFILLPIGIGNLYAWRARKKLKRVSVVAPESIFEYDYAEEVDEFIIEQYKREEENLKKEKMFQEMCMLWENFSRTDFDKIYQFLKEGLYSPENLLNIINEIRKTCPEFDFQKFLELFVNISAKNIDVVLKVSEK